MSIQPKKIYSVSELTNSIKALLEESYAFIWISGEISNYKLAASGHAYFTLKDAASQVNAVMFRGSARRMRTSLKDGMMVTAMGRISVYAPRGAYQLVVEFVEAQGTGELLMAVEALKRKLSAEGLFDVSTKKRLPDLPRHVAVITSASGSVIRDILQVSGRRWPDLPIDVVPVTVQGDTAAREIVAAIDMVVAHGHAEVIILARGGGNIEDLMPFNTESVARAIAACPVPIVSAIGHETDTTIADYVADVGAPTPSAAAELVFPDKMELLQRLEALRQRLVSPLLNRLRNERSALGSVAGRLKHPRRRITDGRLRVDDLLFRMQARIEAMLAQRRERLFWREARIQAMLASNRPQIFKQKLEELTNKLLKNIDISIHEKKQSLAHLTDRLNGLSPLAILNRGYSITRALPQRQALRSYTETTDGDRVEIQLANGFLKATVSAAGQQPIVGQEAK